MTNYNLRMRQDVSIKCSSGEIAKGWISSIKTFNILRPVLLEDGTRTGNYISDTDKLFTVTFVKDRFNQFCIDSDNVGREFYGQALLNAMVT